MPTWTVYCENWECLSTWQVDVLAKNESEARQKVYKDLRADERIYAVSLKVG